VRVPDADGHYTAELKKSRKALEWARYYEEARELARLRDHVEPRADRANTIASWSPQAAVPESWRRRTAAP
jgi:hypothetical protein